MSLAQEGQVATPDLPRMEKFHLPHVEKVGSRNTENLTNDHSRCMSVSTAGEMQILWGQGPRIACQQPLITSFGYWSIFFLRLCFDVIRKIWKQKNDSDLDHRKMI